jgi:hypothetical protein
MTRSFAFKQLGPLPAGAVLTLLALAMFAPGVAEAGCSHLVTSRADSERLSSLIEPLIHNLAGQSEGIPIPPSPRPCSGGLCSGQPAAPAVPATVIDRQLDSWAWNAPVPGCVLTGASFLSTETSDLHPTCQAIAVFRPPPPLLESA